jgi:pimeloyl-ACP methyl ester carboxylesterase
VVTKFGEGYNRTLASCSISSHDIGYAHPQTASQNHLAASVMPAIAFLPCVGLPCEQLRKWQSQQMQQKQRTQLAQHKPWALPTSMCGPPSAPTSTRFLRVDVLSGSPPVRASAPARTSQPAVVIVPGFGSDASEYVAMRDVVAESLGPQATVRVAPVRARTWVACFGGRPVTPVLEIIDACVDEVLRESGAARVTIVGHSAGGWISRIWLSRSATYNGRKWAGADRAHCLVCLGTPHTSAEKVVASNMTFIATEVPDCAEAPDVEYVCFGGSGLQIVPVPGVDVDRFWKLRFWDKSWFGRLSYFITDASGQAVIGDGMFVSWFTIKFGRLLSDCIGTNSASYHCLESEQESFPPAVCTAAGASLQPPVFLRVRHLDF